MSTYHMPQSTLDSIAHIHWESHTSGGRLQSARDYLYQDRLAHRLSFSSQILARLQGFQGYYIPRVQASPAGLNFSCTCQRTPPCAHVVALALAFAEAPESFLAAERAYIAMAEPHPWWWSWSSEIPFTWDQIPAAPAWWMLPPPDLSQTPPAWPWPATTDPGRIQKWCLQYLAWTHPQWWQHPTFVRTFGHWLEPMLGGRAVATGAWIDLQWRGPELPLDTLWVAHAHALSAEIPRLQRLLWATTPSIEHAPRARRMLDLLEIAVDPSLPIMEWLWSAFDWADPYGWYRAPFYARLQNSEAGVRLFESRLPESPSIRITSRRLLIALTRGAEQLGHRIADACENPDPPKIQQLLDDVDGPTRQILLRLLPTTFTVDGGAGPDSP